MPIFKAPKLGYNITPWINGGTNLVPTKDEVGANPKYGKIPVPTLDDMKEFFGGKKKSPKELEPRPQRSEGGTYVASGLLKKLDASTLYFVRDLVLADAKLEGYGIIPRSSSYMESRYRHGVLGYEEGDWMELAYDGPIHEMVKASVHELTAKRLRSRLGYFDHPKNESMVEAEADKVLQEYIERALAMRN